MSDWIDLGKGGAVARQRIVAIANPRSAHVREMLAAAEPSRVLNLTYGYPRQAVLLLDNGYLVIVSRSIEELIRGGGNDI